MYKHVHVHVEHMPDDAKLNDIMVCQMCIGSLCTHGTTLLRELVFVSNTLLVTFAVNLLIN